MNALLKGKFVANTSIFLLNVTACYIAVWGEAGSEERFFQVCLAVSPIIGALITGIWAGTRDRNKIPATPEK